MFVISQQRYDNLSKIIPFFYYELYKLNEFVFRVPFTHDSRKTVVINATCEEKSKRFPVEKTLSLQALESRRDEEIRNCSILQHKTLGWDENNRFLCAKNTHN